MEALFPVPLHVPFEQEGTLQYSQMYFPSL